MGFGIYYNDLCESLAWEFSGGTGTGEVHRFDVPGLYTVSAVITVYTGNPAPTLRYSTQVKIVYGFALSDAPYSVMESDAGATITIRRSAPEGATWTLHYATADDTSIAGVNYVATSGILTFLPGETTKKVTVPILQDGRFVPGRFTFSISNPSDGVILPPSSMPIIIKDNEPPPVVVLTDTPTQIAEGETLRLTFVRKGTAGLPFEAVARLASSTDELVYVTAEFGADDMIRKVSALIAPDHCFSGPRPRSVFLTSATNGVGFTTASTQLTITDIDPRPAVSIEDVRVQEGNTQGVVRDVLVPVHLTGPLCYDLWLDAAVGGGTATTPADYVERPRSRLIAPLATSGGYGVRIVEDRVKEPDEDFRVTLALAPELEAINPTAGRMTATCTIENDDAPPALQSIEHHAAAGSDLHFLVAFSLDVHGVDRTDFTVIEEGVEGSSVAAVDGSGSSYDVTVHPGTFMRTASIALRLLDDDTIRDDGGNPLGGPGSGSGGVSPAIVVAPIPMLRADMLVLLVVALAALALRVRE
jgi:hypothetical protein